MKNFHLAVACALSLCLFNSCEKEDINEISEAENTTVEIQSNDIEKAEEAFPGQKGNHKTSFTAYIV